MSTKTNPTKGEKTLATEPIRDIPGSEFIGCGYNVVDKYANSDSIATQLFIWDETRKYHKTIENAKDEAITFKVPFGIEVIPLLSNEERTCSWSSKKKYEESLEVNVKLEGKYGLFKASFSTHFKGSTSSEINTKYSTVEEVLTNWSLRIKDLDAIKDQLDPSFKKKLNNKNVKPKDLFEDYGSHVLNDILIGGKLTYSNVTRSSKYTTTKDLEVAAKASYALFKGETEVKNKSEAQLFDDSSDFHVVCQGGDPALGGEHITDRSVYMDWKKSVYNTPGLIDFHGNKPLVPIWELCNSQSRKDQLKNAFPDYVKFKHTQLGFFDFEGCVDLITDVQVSIGKGNGFAGYKKVDVDLNHNSGGNFIYLWYKTSTPEEIAENKLKTIVELDVHEGKTNLLPGHELIDVDINRDVKASSFLYVTKKFCEDAKAGDFRNGEALTEIAAIDVETEEENLPEINKKKNLGYTVIETDCNYKAGGNFIFLYFKKRGNDLTPHTT